MTAGSGEIWKEPVRGEHSDHLTPGMPGLERIRSMMEGRLPKPPIFHLTGMAQVQADPGTLTVALPASGWWQSPTGVFAPGVMAFLADASLSGSVVTVLTPGRILVTSDLSISYLRPAGTGSQRLTSRGNVIHTGRTLALSQATVEDGSGRLLAHGTCRCYLLDAPSPGHVQAPSLPETPANDTPDPYLRAPHGEALPQEIWDRMSGLDIIRALIADDLPQPPMHYLTGARWVDAEEGTAVFAVPSTRWLCSTVNRLYGGTLAWLSDVCLGGAVETTLPAGTAAAPLDLKASFLRPVVPDGRDIIARARVTHRGRTIAVASAEIFNADGKRVVQAMGSTLVLPGRPWSPASPVVAEEEPAGEEDTNE